MKLKRVKKNHRILPSRTLGYLSPGLAVQMIFLKALHSRWETRWGPRWETRYRHKMKTQNSHRLNYSDTNTDHLGQGTDFSKIDR